MESIKLLTSGLNNWKLRIILSAILCIMGLAALVSMVLGLFVHLSVYDKSIVAVAIWMVGIPTYLILSGLAKVTPETIVKFINESVEEVEIDATLMLSNVDDLNEADTLKQEELVNLFTERPLHNYLPDKPVKQAYYLMLASMIASFAIWYLSP